MKYIPVLILLGFMGISSCSKVSKEPIIQPSDYNTYLDDQKNENLKEAMAQKNFWSKRLRPDSSGVGDLGPLAAAYEGLFEAEGNVNYLLDAENLYRKAIKISANSKDAYVRGLAHNLISQHRFKEAKDALEESYKGSSNRHQTRLMLFDVYMEIGEYEKAYQMLGEVKNNRDYNYLIRISKWSDYKGNLDDAIKFMERAKMVAESRNSKPLKIWTYSNLGDYYGHAGRIRDSYEHYLMTLELQPDNAYAKKGIAWIAYSWEENTEEALRILDKVSTSHDIPDYLLLRSELAEFDGNIEKAEILRDKFISEASKPEYGDMYNAYLIELFTEKDARRALEMAKQEVVNRPTPEAYHLLALAQLKNGDKKTALTTIEEHVVGKTYEPMAQYHSALVYLANGMTNEVEPIKKELLASSYEMGPLLTMEIAEW